MVKTLLAFVFLWSCLLGCNRGRNVAGNSTEVPAALSADVRITEEPYYAQDIMNEKMDILIAYLEQSTGLKIDYVPAINYAHSHELLLSGKVDLLWAGSLGASKVLDANDKAQPIATEVKSFINVLLVDRKLIKNVKNTLASERPLQVLKGRHVVFGSNYSGSSFLTPLIEMKNQGVDINDLKGCMHEPKHGHRAMFIADNDKQDFAFVPGSEGNPLKFVPDQARSEVMVGWVSEIKRNYFIIASPELILHSNNMLRIQDALLALDQSSSAHEEILNQLGVTGFELPNPETDLDNLNEITRFSAVLGDATRCKKNEKE